MNEKNYQNFITSIGYKYLSDYLEINGVALFPYWRESYVTNKSGTKIIQSPEKEKYYYRKVYKVKNDLIANIEFAIKHEGFNLELLEKVFKIIPKTEIEEYIKANKTNKNARIIWFLYEWLLESRLDISDITPTHYIDLLDCEKYFTAKPNKLKRYCINENLLGNKNFCPFVRKTKVIKDYEEKNLKEKAIKIIGKYGYSLILRAAHYLYTKETKSSSEIEREKPNKKKAARFVAALQTIDKMEQISKKLLIDLQNIIVDEPFADKDYTDKQNYVGQTFRYSEKIHYVAPKPEDNKILMEGLIESYNRMMESDLPAIVIAAAISFGFVFIHPFSDGNGRIHRFLIHYILSKKEFTPANTIFPISAAILENMKEYDEALETFSKKLLPLIDYDLDKNLEMTVHNETLPYYKYIDFTKLAEYLYKIIDHTIENDFEKEIKFLVNYDKAKSEMEDIIEMPDRLVNLFINLTIQNNGILSEAKRKDYFNMLSDNTIQELENIIKRIFFDKQD